MVTTPRPPAISVVIPAYNPQERIFSRVLTAVAGLCTNDAGIDCVIVDNNSTPPLDQMPCVQSLLNAVPSARAIVEREQGLTAARLAGIRATTGTAVVVFDDDNVPGPDYIEVATRCLRDMPWVGVWGPGTIDVDLLDEVPGWLQPRARSAYNERRERAVQYGCVPASWQPYYPIGMGQVIRREVAEAYASALASGSLTATDRKGGSLSSGGDIQIVWQAVRMGMSAGIHPELRMTHVIPGSRTTVRYLQRLAFGCGVSYFPAIAQSFPDAARDRSLPGAWHQAKELFRFVTGRVVRGRVRFLSIDLANVLGVMCGRVAADGAGTDHWTFRLARRLKLT